jgi:cytoskeletal protein RodZ
MLQNKREAWRMMDSIGEILRQEREKRGLSVQEAHDATRITVQSIADLEQDRFDSFANKVYARAFLRDYANFLNLDSAALLNAYEEKWSSGTDREPAPASKSSSGWRAFGYALLIVVIVAGLATGGYFAYKAYHGLRRPAVSSQSENNGKRPEVATIPKVQPVTPPKPEPTPKPIVAPKPQPPVVPQKVVVEVTALLPVWIGVKTDGKTVLQQTLAKGKTLTFEGKNSVTIRAGMAGAVQIKLNGQTQPPMGSLKTPGEKTFALPEAPSAGPSTAPPAGTPGAPAVSPPVPSR